MSTPQDDSPSPSSSRDVPEVLEDVRDALERLGKEVLAVAEDVTSGRRAVVPDSVKASLSDLASGLASVADGAARALQDWSRRLDPPQAP